jgi:hypothetical protein
MRNLKTVIKATEKGRTPLYYNPATKAVYTEPGPERFYLTDLIRPHSGEEIEKTVKYFMSL